MNNILTIMDKECFSKSEVFLYKEDTKWYAYYHSAELLNSPSSRECIKDKIQFLFYGVLLEKFEVDLFKLLEKNWRVELCADEEIMLIHCY